MPLTPDLAVVVDGKKFMWDGHLYDTREASSNAADAYRRDNFEVQLTEDRGTFLVYTRRVVKEVVVQP